MNLRNRVIGTVCVTLVTALGGAYNILHSDSLVYRTGYEQHPITTLIGAGITAVLSGMAFYAISPFIPRCRSALARFKVKGGFGRKPALDWVFLTLGLACLILWLNRYAYVQYQLGGGMSFPVRVNRFTGGSEILRLDRWSPVGSEGPASATRAIPLNAIEVAKIQAEGSIRLLDRAEGQEWWFVATVYNGTDHELASMEVGITLNQSTNQETWTRDYVVRPFDGASVPLLSNGTFGARIDTNPGAEGWGWRIVRAYASE